MSVAPGASQARCVTSWGWATPRGREPPALSTSSPTVPQGPQQPARPQPPRSPGKKVQVSTLLWRWWPGRTGGGKGTSVRGRAQLSPRPTQPRSSKGGLTPPLGCAGGAGVCLLLTARSRSSGRMAHLGPPLHPQALSPQPLTHGLQEPEQLRSPHRGPNARGGPTGAPEPGVWGLPKCGRF